MYTHSITMDDIDYVTGIGYVVYIIYIYTVLRVRVAQVKLFKSRVYARVLHIELCLQL